MENLEKIFLGIFILVSCILVIFFCPVTITIQTTRTTKDYSFSYTPGQYSPNSSTSTKSNTTSHTSEENVCLWKISELSRTTGGPSILNPNAPLVQESPSINYGRLLLEEAIIVGVIFVMYIIVKGLLSYYNIEI